MLRGFSEPNVPMNLLPYGADRNVRCSFHPSVATLLKPNNNGTATNFKYPPEGTHQTFSNQGIAHFAKLLIPDSCVDYLCVLWNSPLNEGTSIRLAENCVVTSSPPHSHFPGTQDRVLCIRAQSFDTLVCRAKEVIMACILLRGTSPPDFPYEKSDQTMKGRVGIRLAVPRKVVGTVIGKGGNHIQTLRQSTQAVIHISPLFVTSEYACSERVISISANLNEFDALQHATLTLLKMINKHPERASCQRTVYKRPQE